MNRDPDPISSHPTTLGPEAAGSQPVTNHHLLPPPLYSFSLPGLCPSPELDQHDLDELKITVLDS